MSNNIFTGVTDFKGAVNITGALAMNTTKITGLAAPTVGTDAANKTYVDSVAEGLDVKESVRLATTVQLSDEADINTDPYVATDGTHSFGQITGVLAVSGVMKVDGIQLVAGDRILLKNQGGTASSVENGIYIVISIITTAYVLERAADFYGVSPAVTPSAFTFVEEGTVNADSGFVLVTDGIINAGGASGDTMEFSQFSGAGQITAGTGLTKSGNTINAIGSTTIIANANSLEVNSSSTANQLLISGGSAGTAATFGAVPLGDSAAVSGQLGVPNGGTGLATVTANAVLKGNTAGDLVVSGITIGGTNVISGLGAPVAGTDAVTKTYADTKVALAGDTMTGELKLSQGASAAGLLTILEDTDLGSNSVSLTVPNVTTSYTVTLPAAVGASGQVMSASDGAGTLVWSTPSTTDATKLPLAGGTMVGDIDMNSNLLNNVGTSTAAASFYELYTATPDWSGPYGVAQGLVYKIARVGKAVVFSIATLSSTSTIAAIITLDTAIPIAFRPVYLVQSGITCIDGGSNVSGSIRINTSGVIEIGVGSNFGVYTNSGLAGFRGMTTSWIAA